MAIECLPVWGTNILLFLHHFTFPPAMISILISLPIPHQNLSHSVLILFYLIVILICTSQRIDTFELWCWRRLLQVPWTARRSNQSILKETSPGCSLEGLMLRLKLQYFGHLMWRVDSLEKTLILGGIGGRRRGEDTGWDSWMVSPTQRTWVWLNSGSWWWTGRPGMLRFMGLQRVGHDWATKLSWTESMF